MDDAAARRRPLDIAGSEATSTALGLHPSLERERHRLEARVRVRAGDQATVQSVIHQEDERILIDPGVGLQHLDHRGWDRTGRGRAAVAG